MSNSQTALAHLRRPSLLIRAARHAAAEYDRRSWLDRAFHENGPADGDNVLDALMSAEAEIEESRRAGHAAYSVTRHIELLVALMGEARHLARLPQST